MRQATPFHLTETPLVRGTSLIEASAGTGKTYAITALFVRLILEEDLSVRDILVVTYTEAATEELRDRVRQMLAQALQAFNTGETTMPFLKELVARHRNDAVEMRARLEDALRGFDEAPIYTIHGFCQRTLRDRAFESGQLFDVELVTDPSDLLEEVAADFWRRHFYDAGRVLVQFGLKNKLGPDQLVRLLRTCINYPQLHFLSQADGRPLESLSAELESSYQLAREAWLNCRKEIKACFGGASKWGNQPYNSDEHMAPLFDELELCFSQSGTAFNALGCLRTFCASALQAGRFNKSKEPVPQHPFFEQCERLCSLERIWLAGLQLAFVVYARQELPRRKFERKIQSFDDLLVHVHQALAGRAGAALAENLRRRYKAALIDEFQDTDPTQYQVFRRAFADGHTFLFMIGDPKQAIYGFRGADIFTYLQAASEATHHFTLGENWRSESGLVTAINKVFSKHGQAFVFDRIEFQEATPKGKADAEPLTVEGRAEPQFHVWFCERDGASALNKLALEKTLPAVVASEIVRLLNGNTQIGTRALKPEDIAVLVLENKQAARIQEALNACRVPNVLYTTASLFASQEASEFRRVLAATASPGRESLVKSALATDLLGIDGCKLEAVTEDEWQLWLARFQESQHVWNRHGFFRMFRWWMQTEQVRARMLAFANGERRLTNLLHLGEVLHQAETERRLGVTGLLKWFSDQMALEDETPEEHQLRLERDENAVRIVTVHKSKGLEYPVVFCPYSWKSSEIKRGTGPEEVFFHDPEQALRFVRDLGPEIDESHRQLAREEKLAENVRLLYVALTRARHRCYFAWGSIRGAGTSAPAWLLHRGAAPAEGAALVDTLEAQFNTLSDDALRAQLETFKESANGTVQIAKLPGSGTDLYQPAADTSGRLQARAFAGRIQRDWVISSFSYLTAGSHLEAPDRDSAIPGNMNPATLSRSERERDGVRVQGTGFFGFAKGAKAGTCLHEILEQVDFRGDEASMARLVQHRLQAHHLAELGACEAVCQMLGSLLRFPLVPDRPEFTLANLPPSARLAELEFYFPVSKLTASGLHELLKRFGWDQIPAQMGRLAFDPVSGFLKGFIDLVFCFEDRYYLVDWKSNWLGNALEDYSQAALRAEMQRQQYFMQYYLYTVALHKYLALRLPGYKYETHFGGVIYLFLRGLDPTRPDHGAFRDRPTVAAVEELSRLLEAR